MLIELRIVACAVMLAIAAIIDFKKREIPDKIWIGFGSFGTLLAVIEFGLNPEGTTGSIRNSVFLYILGIGIITPIAYAVYKTGLFGGADSKALIAIAVILPTYDFMLYKIHGFTVLTVLTNALIISMSQVIINSTRNLIAMARGVPIFEGIDEGAARKALAFAMGYRSTSAVGYLFPMEGIDESGKRKFSFNPARYDEFVEESQSESQIVVSERGIWVTQALPFIVYIAIGLAITLTIGDIFGFFLQSIL